MAGLKQ